MRRVAAVLAPVVLSAACTTTASAATPSGTAGASARPAAATGPSYYLALGDSLSVGHQPSGDTDRGYVDVAYRSLHAADPSLQLVKLGCSGETSASLIRDPVCQGRYRQGSQLAAAEAFLAAHRGRTAYLSIDIGANDTTICELSGHVDTGCVAVALVRVVRNLGVILDRLHRADPTVARAVGLTYYDPFLVSALTGDAENARQSVVVSQTLNVALTGLYARYGFRVADVATAFGTGDGSGAVAVAGHGTQPRNVAAICRYTFMCSDGDVHANDAGYALMGQVVARELRR